MAGTTIHRAFGIPAQWNPSDEYICLSGERLAAMREAFESIRLIIIDETSMVGCEELLFIHRRLNDIFGVNDELFGGLSVIASGDLLQLPPVMKKAIFDLPRDELAKKYGSLWQENFKILEFDEIIRQSGDKEFCRILNDLRVGKLSNEDRATLEKNIKSPEDPDYPTDATHIFCYNLLVDEHNLAKLYELPGPHYTFEAQDMKIDPRTGHKIIFNSSVSVSNGACKFFTVCLNARVVLTYNVDVSDGLANSATGTVTGFYPDPDLDADPVHYKCKYILVQFDHSKIGKSRRASMTNLCPLVTQGSTPINRVDVKVQYGRRRKFYTIRNQFPLSLAWAKTVHKEQGMPFLQY